MSWWIKGAAITAVAAAIGFGAGVRVNWTPSLPVGLYLVKAPGTPQRGEIVEACLPDGAAHFALQRGYIGPGVCEDGTMPVLKPVAAVPGDTVEVRRDGVHVNGELVVPPPLEIDGEGRPLPPTLEGTYQVPEGRVWLLSAHESRSFDSRYFGAFDAARVRSRAWPLLTF